MKMGTLEKTFINSSNHRKTVAVNAEHMLQYTNWKPGHHYLDFGCGAGSAPIHIARNFPLKVTGVDVDPQQIKIAESAGEGVSNVKFVTNQDTTLPFNEGYFDIVATNKVMHHISNWQDALLEIDRVLKPGGYLIYSDFVFPALIAKIGSTLIGDRLGFPPAGSIENFLQKRSYEIVYLLSRVVHFSGVFIKLA